MLGRFGVTGMVVAVLSAAATPAMSANSAPVCQPTTAGGSVFITDSCTDPVLDKPYVDIDRPGIATDPETGVTVSYRYIHGGFTGTKGLFAFYFPAANQYKGRFFEWTYPTVTTEDIAPERIVFAISHGAYVVSSNNAGGLAAGGQLGPYRANAAAAKFSRIKAAQIYGTSARPRGYIAGASGGAFQTIGALENTSGVWDGGVPMVPGVPNAIPSFQGIQLLALRVLGDKLPQIADAVAPGGSGDPYADLTPEQQAVLRETTRLGLPLRGWWQYATLPGAFLAVQFAVRGIDAGYVDDFWSMPGYEGKDPSLRGTRIQYNTTVTGLSTKNRVMLASAPEGDLNGADFLITNGPKAGQSIPIVAAIGNTVELLSNPGITAGTTVRLDNSWLIALQYYQRHQVPTPDQYGWNQYRAPNGEPLHPQRRTLVGPLLDANSAGSVSSGRFHGKMIMLASTMDVQAFPWGADWYQKQAQAALGSNFAGSYRLWYMDNADHVPPERDVKNSADHVVSYDGELQQAFLDLDAWVLKGISPPASTQYSIDADTQVQLPTTAAQRRGVQPVVTLAAASGRVAATDLGEHSTHGTALKVEVNQPVSLSMKAQVPPGAGRIVRVEWDLMGSGTFPISIPISDSAAEVSRSEVFTFTRPGTYFPVVRVTSHRDGSGEAYGLVQNLASVRVVVR